MPELPEIEVAKKALGPVLVGKTIKKFRCVVPKMARPSVVNLAQSLPGRKIISVDRRAKLLILRLDQNEALWLHLKLTGQLVYQCQGKPLIMAGHPMENVRAVPNRFTHAVFVFDDSSRLYFNDLRKFGYIRRIGEGDEKIELGVEPLDKKFTVAAFRRLLNDRPNMKVKQFLLDQSLIAGLGNIYSDEVLYFGGIRPTRRAKNLGQAQRLKLHTGIKKILREAIRQGSTSYDTYAGEKAKTVNYNPYLKVYQREGEPCYRDKHLIKRIKIAGRSAHYCPWCQK